MSGAALTLRHGALLLYDTEKSGKETTVSACTGRHIVDSLELASSRCGDLTPLVYERLFRERPETRALFRTDPSNLIKGSMLELALEAILDFAGDRKAAHRLIFCEVQSHDGYGTTPDLFCVFFRVIADTLHDLLQDQWSSAIDNAWRTTLDALDVYVNEAVRAMRPAG
ncbi:globin [Afipia sp. P52-10]|uniref:globin n=1 Tax=Afipia sp. P52-10 TaxID=1429916 RepID=UPI00390835C5